MPVLKREMRDSPCFADLRGRCRTRAGRALRGGRARPSIEEKRPSFSIESKNEKAKLATIDDCAAIGFLAISSVTSVVSRNLARDIGGLGGCACIDFVAANASPES